MIPGWVDAIEDEVRRSVSGTGRFSARELAERLGVSEQAAVSYISLLAASGRVRIEAVSLPTNPALSTGNVRLFSAA